MGLRVGCDGGVFQSRMKSQDLDILDLIMTTRKVAYLYN